MALLSRQRSPSAGPRRTPGPPGRRLGKSLAQSARQEMASSAINTIPAWDGGIANRSPASSRPATIRSLCGRSRCSSHLPPPTPNGTGHPVAGPDGAAGIRPGCRSTTHRSAFHGTTTTRGSRRKTKLAASNSSILNAMGSTPSDPEDRPGGDLGSPAALSRRHLPDELDDAGAGAAITAKYTSDITW